VRRANDRLRAPTDAEPYRERSGFQVRHDVLITERGAGIALPTNWPILEEFSEKVDLLFEEFLVVRQVKTKERERVDTGTSSEDDFRTTVGEGVER
jgi:hypothetical protein